VTLAVISPEPSPAAPVVPHPDGMTSSRYSAPESGTGGAGGPELTEADRRLLAQLVKAGADLTAPRHVVYYCYARSESAAESMAAAATARGFVVDVRDPLPAYPGQWAVLAETIAVADEAFIAGSTDFFSALAAAHGAEYDGWEASV
jgi:Regulator of ribonuclease activity B